MPSLWFAFQSEGAVTHQKSCKEKMESEQRDQEYMESLAARRRKVPRGSDDIRVEYHPSSGRPTETFSFNEYGHTRRKRAKLADSARKPWRPFQSREDFEFAEIALDASLNQRQTDALIKFVHHCVKSPGAFNISSHAELMQKWDQASKLLTNFNKTTIVKSYQNDEYTFDMWSRDLFQWAVDQVQDPQLIPHFTFDAERLSKYNGNRFKRFVHEPWTANRFWEIQSVLPAGGKPLCFILYADKTKLSSFGTEKGYPVMARLANLPVEIRNSEGIGGGRVVGWLPVIEDEAAHKGKPGYVNFKRAIWHESFYELLKNVAKYSKTGYSVRCGDDVVRRFFLFVLMLSADYEEQTVMALNRGLKGKSPCPVCLVPTEKLTDLLHDYPLRTSESTQKILEEANRLRIEDDRDKLLSQYGLRNIENAFWRIPYSDPFRLLSFDRLHFYHSGLFGDHIWPELQKFICDQGRSSKVNVDRYAEKMPSWRGLNHFQQIMEISFTDGSKYEDISKIAVFALHNELADNPAGYQLLQGLRCYLEIDMYAALEVHTEETIAAGQQALDNFAACMNMTKDTSEKNWNFYKYHSHKHLFEDIVAKGVTRNYNTKPNEKLHGPLKMSYLLRTNFKNVAEQILKIEQHCFVAAFIRQQLDALDEESRLLLDDKEDSGIDDTDSPSQPAASGHVTVGAKQKTPVTFGDLESEHQTDQAFDRFRIKLGEYLSHFLPAHGIDLPGGKHIRFKESDSIREYRFLKVNYESMVDWCENTDYLRCNPLFYNKPRYDYVLVHTLNGPMFAQLLFIFTCIVDGNTYPNALVRPFDKAGTHPRKDQDLGFYRFRARRRKACEFISVESIIRGALLADAEDSNEFLVIDVVDPDMFLRMKKMYPRD
ncbi:hypothetical protein PLICRDRAFT_58549 [Plicaturopsis crispa FD-325 SS-3]|uniref:Uncharacterized protein n=1 Tax=Plicaturopsis crispa FD-325 SS-3 TaxID=944288 RepID=A0A0C9T1V7_PLICR|nr:hypothetical protein PLICRDRAFT_58549 [Plicaturopsis crispa FD-325 SS-3]